MGPVGRRRFESGVAYAVRQQGRKWQKEPAWGANLHAPRPMKVMSETTEAPTRSARGRTVLAIAGAFLLLLLIAGIGLSVAALRSTVDSAYAPAGNKRAAAGGTSTVVGRNDEPVHVAPTRLSFTAKPGEKIAFAAIELRNASHGRGVIEEVTPSRISDGLDVVHIGASDTDRLVGKVVGAQPYDDLYHPEMWLESASGAVLPPRGKTGIQVAFVVAAQRPGRYTMDGATIRYRVGDEVRSIDVPARISLCAAAAGESCRAGDDTA